LKLRTCVKKTFFVFVVTLVEFIIVIVLFWRHYMFAECATVMNFKGRNAELHWASSFVASMACVCCIATYRVNTAMDS